MAKTKAGSKAATREKLKRLRAGYSALKEAMPTVGQAQTPPNGLEDLADRVRDATVLLAKGEATVTSTGSVYPEDLIRLTHEGAKVGAPVRLANAGGKLLCAGSGVSGSLYGTTNKTVFSVFVDSGKTYLKLAKWDAGSWQLGPTYQVAEVELTKCVAVPYLDGYGANYDYSYCYLALFYEEQGMGMVQFWWLDADLTAIHYGTDIWTDESPTNFCGAWTPYKIDYGLAGGHQTGHQLALTLAWMGTDGSIKLTAIKPSWQWSDEENKSYLTANIWVEKTILPGVQKGIRWPAGKYSDGTPYKESWSPDFPIWAPDTQEYSSTAWVLTAAPGMGMVWLSYPSGGGYRCVLELLMMEDHYSDVKETTGEDGTVTKTVTPMEFKLHPYTCQTLIQKGYQPCGAGLFGLRNGGVGFGNAGPYFLGALARVSGPGQKSSVGIESWVSGYGFRTSPAWFGEEDSGYQTNIGLLRACRMGQNKELMAVGCCAEGRFHLFLVEGRAEESIAGGPRVDLAAVGSAAELCESGAGAALAYQVDGAGEGAGVWLQQLTAQPVAVTVRDSRVANAQAVTGGRPGQTIKIRELDA